MKEKVHITNYLYIHRNKEQKNKIKNDDDASRRER